jgi:uncharacterized protein (TIGR02678 family)
VSVDRRPVGDVIERHDLADRQRATRSLLRHPLLTPAGPDPDAFTLVRKHAATLREWFASEAGWTLQVERGVARLRKLPAGLDDSTRPAVAERANAPFSRRRYALLCLVLAALERADAQVTLGRLAERVLALAGDPALTGAGFAFTLGTREDRLDLVAVVRLLISLRVVVKVAGDEQAFVNATGDALYDVDRHVLAGLLVTRRGPSLVGARDFEDRLRALVEDVVPDSAESRNRALRQSLTRRLLDDPVVYLEELSPEERAYLTSQRPFLLGRIAEATGLVPEIRAEGIALLDPTGEATDLRMPEEGTHGHATLLLAERLAGSLRQQGQTAVPLAALHAAMAGWVQEHRSYWRKETREPGAEVGLCRLAIDRLEALGLVRTTGDGVLPRPALARFDYRPPVVAAVQEELR